jgi:hypothetical protein
MGSGWEDRLQVRRIELFGIAAILAAGAALSPGTISGDGSRMLATFLGLFSASLLPTITILVNGMTGSGRSVQAIENLDREIRDAMDALLFMFGCTAVAFLSLMSLSITPFSLLNRVPLLTSEVLPRLGQAIVVLAVAAIITRAGQIPAILRRTLTMRKDIAVEEARRKIIEKAPDALAVRASFATHPDFGKVVPLKQMEEREPH